MNDRAELDLESPADRPGRVLVVQSSSRAFSQVLDWLDKNLAEQEVDVLVTEATAGNRLDLPAWASLKILPGDRFHPEILREEELAELQNKRYDLGVVLYNDLYASGYENVEKLAHQLDCNRLLGFDYQGRLKSLAPVRRWLHRLLQGLNLLGERLLLGLLLSFFVGLYLTSRAVAGTRDLFSGGSGE